MYITKSSVLMPIKLDLWFQSLVSGLAALSSHQPVVGYAFFADRHSVVPVLGSQGSISVQSALKGLEVTALILEF